MSRSPGVGPTSMNGAAAAGGGRAASLTSARPAASAAMRAVIVSLRDEGDGADQRATVRAAGARARRRS